MTTDGDLPMPGPTEPVPTWPEFDRLRDAVEQYLEHEPPDPSSGQQATDTERT